MSQHLKIYHVICVQGYETNIGLASICWDAFLLSRVCPHRRSGINWMGPMIYLRSNRKLNKTSVRAAESGEKGRIHIAASGASSTRLYPNTPWLDSSTIRYMLYYRLGAFIWAPLRRLSILSFLLCFSFLEFPQIPLIVCWHPNWGYFGTFQLNIPHFLQDGAQETDSHQLLWDDLHWQSHGSGSLAVSTPNWNLSWNTLVNFIL